MKNVLEAERQVFEKLRPDLIRTDHGRYVLIHGAILHGLFDSEDEAHAEGYRLLGPHEAFFVRRVETVEEEVPAFIGIHSLLR